MCLYLRQGGGTGMAEDWRSFILEGFMPHYSMSMAWLPSESLKDELSNKVGEAAMEVENCGCTATVCDALPVNVDVSKQVVLSKRIDSYQFDGLGCFVKHDRISEHSKASVSDVTTCDALPDPEAPRSKFQDVKELLAHARAIVHDFRCGVGVGELAEQHQITVGDVEEIIRFAMEMPR